MDGGTRAIRELLEAPGLSLAGVAALAPAGAGAAEPGSDILYSITLAL